MLITWHRELAHYIYFRAVNIRFSLHYCCGQNISLEQYYGDIYTKKIYNFFQSNSSLTLSYVFCCLANAAKFVNVAPLSFFMSGGNRWIMYEFVLCVALTS